MNCDTALDIVIGDRDPAGEPERREADLHVRDCADCGAALEAIGILGLERAAEVPEPPAGAFDRAVRAAVSAHSAAAPRRRSFAGGMLAGAALAASIALAIVVVTRAPPVEPGVRPTTTAGMATPKLELAANETRDVSLSLDTQTAIPGARIHVLVDGDLALDGYAGERELRWTTDLEPGSNQLTIPVVAIGGGGGQLLVEVEHGTRQRRFLVDIAGTG